MPVDIPGGLDVNVHFGKIQGFLQRILDELTAAGTGARRVVSRLNRSDKAVASPIFVGVVEDDDTIEVRKHHGNPPDGNVGKKRFKDENPSDVYGETVNNVLGDIVTRHWNGTSGEKKPRAQQMGKKANCLHQRFIAIRIPVGSKHQHVGTITVGFCHNPDPQITKVRAIMEKWAQSAQSEYVKHLQATFNLNGPTHP